MNSLRKAIFISISFSVVYLAIGLGKAQDLANKFQDEKANPVLSELIIELSNYKIFRKKFSNIDRSIKKLCEKKYQKKFNYTISTEYSCNSASKIKNIVFDYIDHEEDDYVQYILVTYAEEDYDLVKNIVSKRLGRHSEKISDMYRWSYVSDKKLNRSWYPLIYVSKNSSEASGEFFIGLESGP